MLRPIRIADTGLGVFDTSSVDEAERRIEVLLDMLEAEVTAEALAIGRREIDSPRVLLRLDALRVRSLVPDLTLNGPSRRQIRIAVAKVYAEERVVEISPRIAIGDDKADAGFSKNIRRHSADEQIGTIHVLVTSSRRL